jgi:hypothetical protein
MKITYEVVTQLVLKHGRVDAIDANGETKMIGDDPDSIELVEKTADKFRFDGVWYNRKEFEKVLDKYL